LIEAIEIPIDSYFIIRYLVPLKIGGTQGVKTSIEIFCRK